MRRWNNQRDGVELSVWVDFSRSILSLDVDSDDFWEKFAHVWSHTEFATTPQNWRQRYRRAVKMHGSGVVRKTAAPATWVNQDGVEYAPVEKQTDTLNCGDCAFWVKDERVVPTDGVCQRYPQRIEKNALSWCGEHSER